MPRTGTNGEIQIDADLWRACEHDPNVFLKSKSAGGNPIRKQGRFLKQNTTATLEARVGFEPTDGGFADLSLRPLGYRAESKKYSETGIQLSVIAQD